MKKRLKRMRRNGLRLFLATWVVGIWFIFAMLVGGMLLATFQLHRQNEKLQIVNDHLLTNVMMEIEVLSLRRAAYANRKLPKSAFDAANQYQEQMVRDADSAQKQQLVLKIVDQYGRFKSNALAGISEDQLQLGAEMDANLQELRAIYAEQLRTTRETANTINRMSQLWGIIILALAGLLLLWGSVELWLRIFNPIIALSRTARAIATGHMSVRAPVLREDELGSLCETFNTMANAMVERENERMRFVATVAHDLKNPLVVIGGMAHLLLLKGDAITTQEKREWLDRIVQNTRKLEANIAELADEAQVSTGNIHLNLEKVDLCQLTEQIVQDFKQYHQSYQIQCESQAVPLIEADPKKIERVLLNLLSNAMKFSAADSTIYLRVQHNRKWVRLHVRDEGAGMNHEDLKMVFTPFTRLKHTQKISSGTGLGLFSAKRIIDAHGGRIRMRSELGKGTRVVVLLPRKKQ